MQKSLLEIPPYEKIFYKMIFHFFLKIFLSILGVSSISAAVCQTIPNIYPNKPITIIVPYSTGSTADLLARNIGNKLSTKWSVPVIIDNRPGAAGVIGTDAVAKAKGDGYVFYLQPHLMHLSQQSEKNYLTTPFIVLLLFVCYLQVQWALSSRRPYLFKTFQIS
jgi:tripartite-type tricarboxylate transporter receptor subunit TctC